MNRYILFFFVFACLGWIWESFYCTLCERKWANRGFLYGPVCPIYGFGALPFLALHDAVHAGKVSEPGWAWVFLAGFAGSVLLEYPTSWVLEKLFNARWWDYSHIPLNINGRTSLPTSLAFGGASVLLVKVLIPLFDRAFSPLPETAADAAALILTAILSADITLTVASLTDFQKYVASVDEAFQNHMTDFVERVYGNWNSFYNRAVRRVAVFKFPERKKRIAKQLREARFLELIKDYYESDAVREMDRYPHHGSTTTLEHCENVAWISYLINQKLHLNADEKKLVEAAMLHDLFLYDWHETEPENRPHGFKHPEIACENAVKHFGISEDRQEIIRSHMWPLTITKIPKSKEALILCFADKYCALIETVRLNKRFGLRH